MFSKILFTLFHIFLLTDCTLTPKSPKTDKKEKAETLRLGPQDYNVFDKNLVVEVPSAKEILTNYKAFSSKTHETRIEGKVLGYVTPWNNNGYNAAFLFAKKFTHISPVWLQTKKIMKESYDVTGLHDVDATWMADVKKAGESRNLKMVPRIIFEAWSAKDFMELVTDEKEWIALSERLINTAKKYKFDGYVLELWSQVVGRVQNELLVNLVQEIAIRLKKENLEIILVIPPMRSKTPLFDQILFDDLYEYVSGFSLMTYDFSSVHRPGPNAPILWIEDCIKLLAPNKDKREKIFTGFNFYGYDFTPAGGGAITSNDYVRLLQNYKGKLMMDEKSQEHYFEVRESDGKHVIFFPTLFSINERVKLINKLGVGVSIWELGQGLDYFFDLL